jgi:hypothetical protein
MGRSAVAIGLCVMGALLVAAFLQSVSVDPCDYDSGASAFALVAGGLLFGIAVYLLVSLKTARSWVPVTALVATTVVSYFAVSWFAFLAFWVPNCAN